MTGTLLPNCNGKDLMVVVGRKEEQLLLVFLLAYGFRAQPIDNLIRSVWNGRERTSLEYRM